MDQILTYILSAVGILGFFLAGRKVWWAWYVNIANQVLWTIFSVTTQQWGFLLATGFYFVVFSINAYKWTKEYLAKKNEPITIYDVEESGENGEGVYLKAVPAKTMGMRHGYVKPPKLPFTVDMEIVKHYMRLGDTSPAVANEIAHVVSEVMRAHGRDWIQLSERYGIAHEVQRRLDVKLKGTRPDVKKNIQNEIDNINYVLDKASEVDEERINHPLQALTFKIALESAKDTLVNLLKGK